MEKPIPPILVEVEISLKNILTRRKKQMAFVELGATTLADTEKPDVNFFTRRYQPVGSRGIVEIRSIALFFTLWRR